MTTKGSWHRPHDAKKQRDNLDAIAANRGCKDLDRKTPCGNCNCWKKGK